LRLAKRSARLGKIEVTTVIADLKTRFFERALRFRIAARATPPKLRREIVRFSRSGKEMRVRDAFVQNEPNPGAPARKASSCRYLHEGSPCSLRRDDTCPGTRSPIEDRCWVGWGGRVGLAAPLPRHIRKLDPHLNLCVCPPDIHRWSGRCASAESARRDPFPRQFVGKVG
jgi:hypothetical protein